jgi:hypothetical protein
MNNNGKKFRHYEIYETKNYGTVKLLKYSEETKEKRKVCKVDDDSKDYFFIPESELIPHKRERKIRKKKLSPVEAQREYHQALLDQGFKPKTFYISEHNTEKLERLKAQTGIKTWNDFINHLIESI